MARKIDDIQRDIERTRRQLASTLDELADRSRPQNMVNDAKQTATAKLRDPQIQKILLGVGAVIVGGIVISVLRSRKRSNDIKELQKLLAGRV